MSVRQKISDLVILLQRDRKYQLGAVAIGGLILFAIFSPGAPQHGGQMKKADNKKPQKQGTAISNKEVYNDMIEAFSHKLDTVAEGVKKTSKDLADTNVKVDDLQNRTAEIFKKILVRMADNQGRVEMVSAPVQPSGQGTVQQDDTLEQFGNVPDKDQSLPPPPAPGKVAYIGAGDSVRIKLLAGVNAPTDGTPYPVVFKLVSDVMGPDGSALPLGEARLVAAAQGSLTDHRALFRLVNLNVAFPDGRRKVLDVDGWVVGEDGIRGMEGILLDPIGKAVAAGAMVGAIDGLGKGLSDSQTSLTGGFFGNTTKTVTGDPGLFMLGQTASGASKQWDKILADRVSKLVPHVQVFSGREATAVFAKSVAIRDMMDAINAETVSASAVD